MWTFSNSSGMATTVVDLTTELSPLLIGLVSLLMLSAAMIAVLAIRQYLSEQRQLTPQVTLTTLDYRKVA